jgi:hypothetical protein
VLLAPLSDCTTGAKALHSKAATLAPKLVKALKKQ